MPAGILSDNELMDFLTCKTDAGNGEQQSIISRIRLQKLEDLLNVIYWSLDPSGIPGRTVFI